MHSFTHPSTCSHTKVWLSVPCDNSQTCSLHWPSRLTSKAGMRNGELNVSDQRWPTRVNLATPTQLPPCSYFLRKKSAEKGNYMYTNYHLNNKKQTWIYLNLKEDVCLNCSAKSLGVFFCSNFVLTSFFPPFCPLTKGFWREEKKLLSLCQLVLLGYHLVFCPF